MTGENVLKMGNVAEVRFARIILVVLVEIDAYTVPAFQESAILGTDAPVALLVILPRKGRRWVAMNEW